MSQLEFTQDESGLRVLALLLLGAWSLQLWVLANPRQRVSEPCVRYLREWVMAYN
jgi:hypothetical protein